MKLTQILSSMCVLAALAVTGCSDEPSKSQHSDAQQNQSEMQLSENQRAQLSDALTLADLAHYWELNPGVREWAREQGRFADGDTDGELAYAKIHLKWNPAAKWDRT